MVRSVAAAQLLGLSDESSFSRPLVLEEIDV
jgi:hypothetical protein